MGTNLKDIMVNIVFAVVANVYFKYVIVAIYGFVSAQEYSLLKVDLAIFHIQVFVLAIVNIGIVIYLASIKMKINKRLLFSSAPIFALLAVIIEPMRSTGSVNISLESVMVFLMFFCIIPFAGVMLNNVFQCAKEDGKQN